MPKRESWLRCGARESPRPEIGKKRLAVEAIGNGIKDLDVVGEHVEHGLIIAPVEASGQILRQGWLSFTLNGGFSLYLLDPRAANECDDAPRLPSSKDKENGNQEAGGWAAEQTTSASARAGTVPSASEEGVSACSYESGVAVP